jgi:hypothetical protein
MVPDDGFDNERGNDFFKGHSAAMMFRSICNSYG